MILDKYLFVGGYAQAVKDANGNYSFALYYFNQDHLGNNREVVDENGTVVQVTNSILSVLLFMNQRTDMTVQPMVEQ